MLSEFLRSMADRLRGLSPGGPTGAGEDEVAAEDAAPAALSERHLENTRVLPDRERLLEELPAGAVVAELGVDEGDFARRIHAVTRPETLYLVDPWDTDRYHEGKMRRVDERFAREIEAGQVRVVRKRSEAALAEFPDGYLDWVYIDTTHLYAQTLKELELSRRKVREGGLIAGHDYCVGNPSAALAYGVVPAVHRFCAEHDWELVFLTLETDGRRSFALRKR